MKVLDLTLTDIDTFEVVSDYEDLENWMESNVAPGHICLSAVIM